MLQLSLMLVLISPCFPNACPEATSGILYELFGSNTYFFWHQENDFGKLEDEVFFFLVFMTEIGIQFNRYLCSTMHEML